MEPALAIGLLFGIPLSIVIIGIIKKFKNIQKLILTRQFIGLCGLFFTIFIVGFYYKDSNVNEPVKNNPVHMAHSMCQVISQTGLATECQVNSKNIDIRINLADNGWQTICNTVASQGIGLSLSGWYVRIFSPLSGEHPMATCAIQ